MLLAIVAICALVAAWTVYPLLTGGADDLSGDGLDVDSKAAAWKQEKDRLVAEMVALDIALSEHRIDASDHSEQRNRLMSEAEEAAARLSKLRTVETTSAAPRRNYPRLGLALALIVIVGGSSLALMLNQNDMRSDVNPHADGSIPLPKTMAGGPQASSPSASQANRGPMFGPDGAPDVGAMVARLESRVNEGNPTLDDVIMLARSYRVLNREDESLTLYRKAQTMAPDDAGITLVLASALIRSEKDAHRDEGEEMVDTLLASDPKKPEALWLKSIGLVRRHEIDAAKQTLTQLSALAGENSQAKLAVTGLLKELETASASAPGTGANPTPQAPDGQRGAQSHGKRRVGLRLPDRPYRPIAV